MGDVLGFKPKTLVDAPVEPQYNAEEKCDGCNMVFLFDDLYLDSEDKLLCSDCIGNKKERRRVEDRTS